MRTLLSVVGAFAAMLAGSALAQEPIKIGVTQPLTGAFAASGNYVAQGARLAEEDINAAGGVLNRKIPLIVEGNKSNPAQPGATARDATQEGTEPGAAGPRS